MSFSPFSLDERYSRQVLFPSIGEEGQRKLAGAKVAVIGCGATGSAIASLLARSGVGHISIIDRDYVELRNSGKSRDRRPDSEEH